jgi:RNA polymerase sigma-70 factor (ECF subfamily)
MAAADGPANQTSAVDERRGPLSFDAFFRAEYRAVVGLVQSLTRSRAVAEDVAQEAFATAHLRWGQVHDLDRPDLWVRRVALNRAISVGRSRNAEQRALERLKRYAVPLIVPVSDPHDDELWARVRALPRRQAQLVALVYRDDQSVDDAAAALGLTASTARTHLQRARSTLADVLPDPRLDAPDEEGRS